MSNRPIRTRSLSLKCAELRCKKSLCWQTYSLLTNQSGTNNERKKRQNKSPQRTYSTPCRAPHLIVETRMGRVQTDDKYQVTTLPIYLCLHHVTYLPTIYWSHQLHRVGLHEILIPTLIPFHSWFWPLITTCWSCRRRWTDKTTHRIPSISNIIQYRMSYPSSFFFSYFATQGGFSFSTARSIWFSIPIRFWMLERKVFRCVGIDAFVQRTICFQQIEYQPRHLSNKRISDVDRDKIKRISTHNEGNNEVWTANNQS